MALRFLLLLAVSASAQAAVGVRLILGLTDQNEAKWDGSAAAERARIVRVDSWRFEGDDAIQGSSWTASTHPIRLFGGGRAGRPPIVANGVIVWLDGEQPDAVLSVKTAQGNFSIRLAEIPYGQTKHLLDGRVMADRIPPVARLTSSPEEQDYPAAAADRDGNLWLAYLEFRHNAEHDRLRANFTEPPKDLRAWKAPPGGDQVFVMKYSRGKWGAPVAITPAGGDLYRPAVAVDGSNRAWVFWSANEKGNFDLFARSVANGVPGATLRLTNVPGSDIFPVAATDAKGRVWVAWQGWREGKAAIFAAVQQGDRFSAPVAVSSAAGGEWNPAIAADSMGAVSVAWDSYRSGNYDVYARTATAPGKWGGEVAVAATARYEAYPSIAYDQQGRLWVAWEEGAEGWGKDWGAYETSGVALYQGRAIRLVGLERGGGRVEPDADLGRVLPGLAAQRIDSETRQSGYDKRLRPDPEIFKGRRASGPSQPHPAPRNSLPRLAVDASGRLWLAFRSSHPVWWNPIGTVWTEYVVSTDGGEWTGPVFLANSDNLLDNRPAVASLRPGELLVIGSADGRRQFSLAEGRGRAGGRIVADPYNNDLHMNVVTLAPAKAPLPLKAAAAAPPAKTDLTERATIDTLRNYRLTNRHGALRIVRGEFHRHSEVSGDGGNDGTILDQWRYILDPARMDWAGCCDHDNGGGREYTWWTTQKQTDLFYTPGRFVPMFSYERSVQYPEGHRNVVFAQRGVRTLPRLPLSSPDVSAQAPDTQMFYAYLRHFDGIVASHTSGTNMGTDWRDNDPALEPVVEIYQGERQNYEMPGAPRSNSEQDSIGGWRPKGFVNLALELGYKLGFQSSSDHISTHMSYCNLYARDLTRESLLDAFKKRHVYASTDNILADVRSGDYMMGDIFSTAAPPELRVKLAGTAPFAKVHVIKDNKYAYSIEPKQAAVEFSWRDNTPQAGKMSYYYVRGEQADGEIVWASPLWITYTGK